MLYKYINEHSIYAATEQHKLRFKNEGTELVSFYLTDQQLKELGFKELVRNDSPEAKEFYHIETTYVDGDSITEVHTLVKDVQPNLDELVHLRIRERYTENDEFKMARTGKDTEEWIEYNEYVKTVDQEVREYIERWRNA